MAKGSSIAQRKVRVTIRRVTEHQATYDTLVPVGMSSDYALGQVAVMLEHGVLADTLEWVPIRQETEPLDVKDVE